MFILQMDSLQRKKRSVNITNEQRTLLIEFMNKHPELLRGKLTSTFTLKHSVCLWNEITEILNAVNGANKSWKEWRKVSYTTISIRYNYIFNNSYLRKIYKIVLFIT